MPLTSKKSPAISRYILHVDSQLNQINPNIIESNLTKHEYYLSPNTECDTETKFEILLGEVFQYSIE